MVSPVGLLEVGLRGVARRGVGDRPVVEVMLLLLLLLGQGAVVDGLRQGRDGACLRQRRRRARRHRRLV